MAEPDIRDSFIYEGRTVNVEWFDVDSVDKLPDVKWQQVYAIGELDGLVPLVVDKNGKVNLPGGHVDLGETVEQTMRREIEEEMNCGVANWRLLGYQKLSSASSEPVYQVRVFAKLERIGEFIDDPGGSIVGYKLIPLNQLNQEIGYGKVGEHLVELVASVVGD